MKFIPKFQGITMEDPHMPKMEYVPFTPGLDAEKEQYIHKGTRYFSYYKGDLIYQDLSARRDIYSESCFEDYCGDLIAGKDFLSSVLSGGFSNYDGTLSAIYVDGWKTNLGLHSLREGSDGRLLGGEFWQGEFPLDP